MVIVMTLTFWAKIAVFCSYRVCVCVYAHNVEDEKQASKQALSGFSSKKRSKCKMGVYKKGFFWAEVRCALLVAT